MGRPSLGPLGCHNNWRRPQHVRHIYRHAKPFHLLAIYLPSILGLLVRCQRSRSQRLRGRRNLVLTPNVSCTNSGRWGQSAGWSHTDLYRRHVHAVLVWRGDESEEPVCGGLVQCDQMWDALSHQSSLVFVRCLPLGASIGTKGAPSFRHLHVAQPHLRLTCRKSFSQIRTPWGNSIRHDPAPTPNAMYVVLKRPAVEGEGIKYICRGG